VATVRRQFSSSRSAESTLDNIFPKASSEEASCDKFSTTISQYGWIASGSGEAEAGGGPGSAVGVTSAAGSGVFVGSEGVTVGEAGPGVLVAAGVGLGVRVVAA